MEAFALPIDAYSCGVRNDATLNVIVRDMTVMADIGICPDEIGHPQIVRLNVSLRIVPPIADNIASTIDYREIGEYAVALGRTRIDLIETFARRLADACLAHPSVLEADVSIEKPGALRNGLAAARIVLRSTAPVPSSGHPALPARRA
ncbi:dihydroneopterin aldolase [Sphingomonadaceae bacterium G21617-S1]|jgi:dihydroneopterin aldolase|uniref:dihydroneopterin aldolase n=1 Tax=Rhizorhabdus sp. TaxID=1968843 RepID=UPI0019A3F6E7|nr:dihydroneopterin aldolase [Rhizorhabdus sp.]MBD3760392.1 dihydroneopterin aldolase [Rhizorhabdus sp.]MCZ4340076.1 dihydroneopterin aldolase [Sphingomonadaceae bacterium G21617-S1]